MTKSSNGAQLMKANVGLENGKLRASPNIQIQVRDDRHPYIFTLSNYILFSWYILISIPLQIANVQQRRFWYAKNMI